jgi:phosphoribosyl 1,2-cyclic phosphate phosphodiesterase
VEIIFLGTGTSQGVPVIACECPTCKSSDPRDKRLRSSIYIQQAGVHLVIDSGPDFRQQMLNARINKLDAIIYTHGHKDHVAGLDDVRAYNFVWQKPMDIYAENRVIRIIKNEFSYVFTEEKYPGVPEVNVHSIDEKPFEVNGVEIIPVRAMHYRLPVLGFRIGDFVYLTDANFISEKEKEKMKNAKYLVITALRERKHLSHFNLQEALEIIEQLNPEQAFLTHMSHQMGRQEEMEKKLPENVHFAYDGLALKL